MQSYSLTSNLSHYIRSRKLKLFLPFIQYSSVPVFTPCAVQGQISAICAQLTWKRVLYNNVPEFMQIFPDPISAKTGICRDAKPSIISKKFFIKLTKKEEIPSRHVRNGFLSYPNSSSIKYVKISYINCFSRLFSYKTREDKFMG